MSDPWFLNILTEAAGQLLGGAVLGAAGLSWPAVRRLLRARKSTIDRREQDVR